MMKKNHLKVLNKELDKINKRLLHYTNNNYDDNSLKIVALQKGLLEREIDIEKVIINIGEEINRNRDIKEDASIEDKLIYNGIIQGLLYAKILLNNIN